MTIYVYAFEEPHASFLLTLKCHKHGHVHIGNALIQRGGGGGQGVWKTTISIGFYRKMQFGPITLEKARPPEICDPPPPVWTLQKL